VLLTRWLTTATAVLCPRGVVLCVEKGQAKLIYARLWEAIKHPVTAVNTSLMSTLS